MERVISADILTFIVQESIDLSLISRQCHELFKHSTTTNLRGGVKNDRHENTEHEIVGQVHSSEAANTERLNRISRYSIASLLTVT